MSDVLVVKASKEERVRLLFERTVAPLSFLRLADLATWGKSASRRVAKSFLSVARSA